MKKLDDSQVLEFDTEFVSDGRWKVMKPRIDRNFPSGRFRFLDIGGGNGRLADRILAEYPGATGVVLDNSELLLSKNETNERKTLVVDSVENLSSLDGKFDLVCIHWLLHHLVSDSYQETRNNQLSTLTAAGELLTSNGIISIFENIYTGYWFERLPGRLIFALASSRVIAGITRRMGANTAGIGVCFLSKAEWVPTMEHAGLTVLKYTEPDDWIWPVRIEWRVFLHLKQICTGHFWLKRIQ